MRGRAPRVARHWVAVPTALGGNYVGRIQLGAQDVGEHARRARVVGNRKEAWSSHALGAEKKQARRARWSFSSRKGRCR